MRNRLLYGLWIGWMLHGNATSAQSCFTLDFANDVWNTTDRYYTQGLRLSYLNPGLSKPVKYLFPQLTSRASDIASSIELFQDIYTPNVHNTNVYDPNDRPYSAVLAVNYRYLQWSPNNTSTIQLNEMVGVIGKGALGEEIQNGVHDVIDNLHALGWSYQLETGILLNAGGEYERNLIQANPFRMSALGSAQLGTYKINAQLGLTMYLENGQASYAMPLRPQTGKWFRHQFIVQGITTMVGYDATLQGALFQNYTYGLPSDKISRLVLLSKAEYRLLLGRFQFGVSEYIQSPEFKGAFWHKWLIIHLGWCF